MRIIISLLSLGVSGLIVSGIASPPAKSSRDMNILMIMVEDWSAFAIGAYGNPVVQTPHVDRLAQQGLRFDRAYCQGTVCNPSRASLVTGLRPDSTRVYGNGEAMDRVVPTDAPSLARVLKARDGAWLGNIGKLVHRWDEAQRFGMGFDLNEYTHPYDILENFAGEQSPVPAPPGVSVWAEDEALLLPEPHGTRLRELQAERESRKAAGEADTWELRKGFQQYHAEMIGDSGLPEEAMEDGRIARRTVDLLGQLARREGGKPFFLSVGFYATHTPLLAPKKYVDLYDPAAMELSPAQPERDIGVPPIARRMGRNYDIFNGLYPQFAQTPEREREALAAYYACATYVDAQIGLVLEGLEAAGLADNTIVVFFSDHGFQLGEHGMWSKFSLFEQSTRVPLIVRIPGAAENGRVTDAMVELVDVLPTLAEWWGLARDPRWEGDSFAPLVKQPDQPWKEAVFATIPISGLGRMVRTPGWRYSEWRKDTALPGKSAPVARELYDLRNDPLEQINLADDPAHAAQAAAMAARLQAGWQVARPPGAGK
ncbi:MAG: Sulfatase protein [Verrucomicrobiota bacterium]|nr:Sulfatase protein [Verrucomicrobiota bacterium]